MPGERGRALSLELQRKLITDLRQLHSESRRKDSDLRAAIEATQRAVAELSPGLRGTKTVLDPLTLALSKKVTKLSLAALSYLHSLLSCSLLDESQTIEIISSLKCALSLADEDAVAVKLCQSVISTLTNDAMPNEEAFAEGFAICIQLHAKGSPLVRHTSLATLQQLVSSLLVRVANMEQNAEQEDGNESPFSFGVSDTSGNVSRRWSRQSISIHARLASMLIQDLCMIAQREPPLWIPIGRAPQQMALEVLASAIEQHAQIFRELEDFEQLVRERIVPLATFLLRSPFDMAAWARTMRVSMTAVLEFCMQCPLECGRIVRELVRRLAMPQRAAWEAVMVLEALRGILASDNAVRVMLIHFDQGEDQEALLSPLASTLRAFLDGALASSENESVVDVDDAVRFDTYVSLQEQQKTQSSSSLHLAPQTPAPIVLPYNAISLALKCITLLAHAVQRVGTAVHAHGDANGAAATEEEHRIAERCAAMASGVTPHIVPALLQVSRAQGGLSPSVEGLEQLAVACGVMHHAAARDEAVGGLCALASPERAVAVNGEPALSVANVAAVMALLRVAGALADSLGTSWSYILEALDDVSQVLAFHHVDAVAEAAPSDVNMKEMVRIRDGIERLFTESADVDDEALSHILSALCALSLTRAAAPGSDSNASLFGVDRTVDLCERNLDRMAPVWEVVDGHLSCLANHANQRVRQRGAEALVRVVHASLARRARQQSSTKARDDAGEDPNQPPAVGRTPLVLSAQDAELQRMMLASMAELHRSEYADTRVIVLRGLRRVLESSGGWLSDGAWALVLSILSAAAADTREAEPSASSAVERVATPPGVTRATSGGIEPASVASGTHEAFEVAQLVVGDFLDGLSAENVAGVLRICGLFARQSRDANLALSALGMVWTVGDVLRSRELGWGRSTAQPRQAGDGWRDGDGVGIWATVFEVLQTCAVDSRAEVRNSAVRTMMTSLSSLASAVMAPDGPLHGALAEDAWPRLVERVLFGALDLVTGCALRAPDASLRQDQEVLGREKGKTVVMMVHHSRNTETKQWDETRVLALTGASRLFHTLASLFETLPPWYAGSLRRLLQHILGAFADGSEEVAIAAVQCLQQCFELAARRRATDDVLWNDCWGTCTRCCDAAGARAGSGSVHPHRALARFAQALLAIRRTAGADASEEDCARVLRCAQTLAGCASVSSIAGATPQVNAPARAVSPAQAAVLEVLTTLDAPAVVTVKLVEVLWKQWPSSGVVALDCDAIGRDAAQDREAAQSFRQFERRAAASALGIVESDVGSDPSIAFASLSAGVVALRPVLLTIEHCLWEDGVDALVRLLRRCVPILAAARDEDLKDAAEACGAFSGAAGTKAARVQCWLDMLDTVRAFLYGADGIGEMDAHGAAVATGDASESAFGPSLDRVESAQLAVLRSVLADVVPACAGQPLEVQRQLLALFDRGCCHAPALGGRAAFSIHCFEALLDICHFADGGVSGESRRRERTGTVELDDAASEILAPLAAPLLVSRCASHMLAFLRDEEECGDCPLPKFRYEEIMFVLERLRTLTLHPDVTYALLQPTFASEPPAMRSGCRGHLLRLFPVLIDAVRSRTAAVREALGKLMHDAAKELQLE